MARLSIAQLREKELSNLVAFRTNKPTEEDYKTARRLMNSFYRLCGLAETNLYLANDERTCNKASTKYSEEKERKWAARLSKEFTDYCGLRLVYCGYAPSIGIVYPGGGFSEKITRWFYQ